VTDYIERMKVREILINCGDIDAEATSYVLHDIDQLPAVDLAQCDAASVEDERKAFIDAHCRNLDLTETNDAWGRPIFKHTHIEAMWDGWKKRAELGSRTPAGCGGQSGRAGIVGDQLVIALDVASLPVVVRGAGDTNNWPGEYTVTDATAFAKELVYQLNAEDERGTTAIHRMFDRAILHAVEYGAEGIDFTTEEPE
jgi:hypothetical protein